MIIELKNRGVQDIFIASVDGLKGFKGFKGFPEVLEAVYTQTQVKLRIVHMVRHSLNYVSWKQDMEVAAGLRRIYSVEIPDEAKLELDAFAGK